MLRYISDRVHSVEHTLTDPRVNHIFLLISFVANVLSVSRLFFYLCFHVLLHIVFVFFFAVKLYQDYGNFTSGHRTRLRFQIINIFTPVVYCVGWRASGRNIFPKSIHMSH
jgi:hypothetical protein